MIETILLTGASGNQCSRLIPRLLKDERHKLRLVVNSEKSLAKLQSLYPDTEILQADYTRLQDCISLYEGVTSVYHVGPSFHPAEMQIGLNMINAAVIETKRPGNLFKHFVYSSVLHPEFSKMLNHDRKRYIEEYLCETSLNWTILQPSHFADPVIERLLQTAKAAGDSKEVTFKPLFNPSTVFCLASLEDFGEASAKVLKDREQYYFATYALVSTSPMPYHQFIETVGASIGKTFKLEPLELDKAVDIICMAIAGRKDVDPRLRDGPERMLLFYGKRGLLGNPSITKSLLGREPSNVERMVEDVEDRQGGRWSWQ